MVHNLVRAQKWDHQLLTSDDDETHRGQWLPPCSATSCFDFSALYPLSVSQFLDEEM